MDNNEEGSIESSEPGRSGVVTARGTAEGLVIRLDGRADSVGIQSALEDFVESRRRFLSGNEVSLEWIGEEPDEDLVSMMSDMLLSEYNISVRSSYLKQAEYKRPVKKSSDDLSDLSKDIEKDIEPNRAGLFGGVNALESSPTKNGLRNNSDLWDDPNSRVVFATLRSGQKIETEHTLIIFGDINSGAELVAGGDIVVLGTLRGVAHAGAYDESGGGSVIFALNMQPTQLRIGSVISRGSNEPSHGSEVARVDGNSIVVEPYKVKEFLLRRRD